MPLEIFVLAASVCHGLVAWECLHLLLMVSVPSSLLCFLLTFHPFCLPTLLGGSDGKESVANAGDPSLIPGV